VSTLEPMARGSRACRSRLEGLQLEAPVGAMRSCGARSSRSANDAVNPAHTDLNIRTNERGWDSERCGFHIHTRIVQLASGKSFWDASHELPMSPEGKVAWPEMEAVKGGTWNEKEFGTMPRFDAMPNGFGIEVAK